MRKAILIFILGLCVALAAAQPVAIHGTVLRDDTGEAVSWADIRVSRASSRYLEAHLETEQNGQFGADNLPEGRYTLLVEKRGFLISRIPVEDPRQPLTIRLIRAGSISGRVINSQGKPFLKARVDLVERAQGGPLRPVGRPAQVQKDGTYSFTGLRPGHYLLLAHFEDAPGESSSVLYPSTAKPQVLTITRGEDYTNCDFVGEAGNRFPVSGRIETPTDGLTGTSTGSAESKPRVRRESVALSLADEPGIIVAWALTDKDGSFSFPAVPWGNYVLRAAGPIAGYGSTGSLLTRDANLGFAHIPVSVNAEVKDISLVLEESRSLQLLLEADTTEQGQCPKVLEASLDPLEAWGAMLQRDVKLVAGEVVTVQNLAPARYGISPGRNDADGCQVRFAQVIDLRHTRPMKPVRIRASASGSIVGTIVDPQPEMRLQVLLLPLDMRTAPSGISTDALRIATVATDGTFRFEDTSPGRYALHVAHADRSASQNWFHEVGSFVEVEITGGVVEVSLHAPVDSLP